MKIRITTLAQFIEVAKMDLSLAYSKQGINRRIKEFNLSINRDLKIDILSFFKCW